MSVVRGYYVRGKGETFQMPVESEVLSVGNGSENRVILWVKDTEAEATEERRFVTFINEEKIPTEFEKMRYVGTVSFGRLPIHVFEVAR